MMWFVKNDIGERLKAEASVLKIQISYRLGLSCIFIIQNE